MLARHFGSVYGWIVVGAIALVLSASNGTRYSFGMILKPLTEEFGADRATIAAAVSISVILRGFMQPVAGYCADRFGPKRVLMAGLSLLVLALLMTSLATELWQVYLFYGVVSGLGFAATSQVSASPIVANWFIKRRATALSLATAGVAIGQLVLVPTTMFVLLRSSWQVSFQALAGVILLIILPLGWLLIKSRPAEIGREADGQLVDPAAQPRAAEARTPLRVAAASPAFWQLGFGFFVCGFTMSFPATHLIPFATDMGMPEMDAANALGLMGGFSLAGSLALGFLSDRIGRKNALALTYFLRGIAFFALMASNPGLTFYLAALIVGISWTATVPLTSAITADVWGRASLGTIFGFIFITMEVGSGLGAFVDGLVYDYQGSYQWALILNAALGLLAAAVVFGMRDKPREPGEPAPVPPGEPVLAAR